MLSKKVKTKANIGMLVHGYYPVDVRVRREAEALVEAGYSVAVICLSAKKQPGKEQEFSKGKVNGVSIYRLPITRKRGKFFRYVYEYLGLAVLGGWKLIRLHIKNPFQVIHIHNMPNLLVLAGLIPKWMGAKLLLDIHDPMPELYSLKTSIIQNRWVERLLRWEEMISCRVADYIISVNKAMHRNLKEKGIDPKKIFILHNFPDTRYFPIRKDVSNWPRHKDGLVLLYAGTVTIQYRLDVAIEALSLIKKYIDCVKLRILGDGNDLDRVLRLANKLGIREHVEHLRTVNVERVHYIMKDADIGISCHQGGVFGDLVIATKTLDYLTQGLPVICSRTKTMVDYIPEEAIFYFEPEDARDMAKQIIKIWRNPDLVRRKMKNAEKYINKYKWQTEKRKFIHFYQEILK